jgi:hypothetical protein
MKDFDGGPDYLGIRPLGKGRRRRARVAARIVGQRPDDHVRADPSPNQLLALLEAA